ncbi:MAG: hypothetical protein LBI78_06560 [Campylobacteraceae bacterium]|jgi:hypothetical protein|nr:hypothetical protein [Campylobacteraceae bacterium]
MQIFQISRANALVFFSWLIALLSIFTLAGCSNDKNFIEIRTEMDLYNIRYNLLGNYTLLNDITLNTTLDALSGWEPIGDNVNSFTGIFEGNGHKINNLWINRLSTTYVGLFGYLRDARIKNLGVEIDSSKGGVKGHNNVGSIAGMVNDSSITNSYSTGDVSGGSFIGGIAGDIFKGEITNSYSNGDISGSSYIGGITGELSISADIVNSYSKGNISGGSFVGGIAGIAGISASIINSYSMGNISGNNYIGGIAGEVSMSATVLHNVAINQIINGSNANRIVGYNSGGTVHDNFALNIIKVNDSSMVSNNNLNGEDKSDMELKIQSTYENLSWRFGNYKINPWKIDESSSYPYFYWQK